MNIKLHNERNLIMHDKYIIYDNIILVCYYKSVDLLITLNYIIENWWMKQFVRS